MGLILLMAGVWQLYTLLANPGNVRVDYNPVAAEAGCVVWMGVGVYLIIKGTTRKAG